MLCVINLYEVTDLPILFHSSVQQAPVCTHQSEQSQLQRPPAGVCGHQANLRQVPREERRPEGAVCKGPSKRFLSHQVLGERKTELNLLHICLYVCGLRHLYSKPNEFKRQIGFDVVQYRVVGHPVVFHRAGRWEGVRMFYMCDVIPPGIWKRCSDEHTLALFEHLLTSPTPMLLHLQLRIHLMLNSIEIQDLLGLFMHNLIEQK